MTADNDVDQAIEDQPTAADESAELKDEPLKYDLKIEEPSACERHLTVTIEREEIDRYFDEAFQKLMETADVPGFRKGRAPRQLVEQRFRKDVKDQVKGSLLMDALGQITEESDLAAISEPDIDVGAIELPDEGPLVFEFNLEVRPDFEVPNWKGLKIERPSREFSKADVDQQLERLLAERGRLVPHDGAAKKGDYITVDLKFKDGDRVLSESKEEVIRIRPVLSFRDARIEKFDKLMSGVKGGETREVDVTISEQVPNESLRGKTIKGVFDVQEVKRLELPELTDELLEELGDFDSEAELRDAIQDGLKQRLAYEQQQRARQQVLATLTEAANWELPPDLVRRQTKREVDRMAMELRSAGFSEDEIRTRSNQIWQNSQSTTETALKEHFILERIAEEENITVAEGDYDEEIARIAQQSQQSPRRVRAQLEKRGLMDSLRNQIIERKTVAMIVSHAKFKDVPFDIGVSEEYALEQSAGGGTETEIPEAKYDDAAQPLKEPKQHD